MNINTYLEQLQTESFLYEADIKSLINMPKEKIEKSIEDMKTFIKISDISKLKSLAKVSPKADFPQIEKYAKTKIKNFDSLYTLAKKVMSNSLGINENEKGIKQISAILALGASMDKNPMGKLKELLKKIVSKSKIESVRSIGKFILSILAYFFITFSITAGGLQSIPMLLIYFVMIDLIYRFL